MRKKQNRVSPEGMVEKGEKDKGVTIAGLKSSESAMARLFERHNEALVKFLVSKLGSLDDAYDVAQEAYAKILGLDDDKIVHHVRAYLFRTANNLAIDRIRERQRRSNHCDLDDVAGADIPLAVEDPEVQAEANRRINRMRLLLEELPPKCRMAFMMYKFELQSYGEIAQRMEVSESMVRKYVLRALRHCKDGMAELETKTGQYSRAIK